MKLFIFNRLGENMAMKTTLLNGLAVFLLLCVAVVQSAEIQNLTFAALPERAVQVILTADQDFSEYKEFSMAHPARIVIDFLNMSSGLKKKKENVGIGVLRSVIAVEVSGTTRLVINLSKKVPYRIEVRGKKVFITVNARTSVGPTLKNNAMRSNVSAPLVENTIEMAKKLPSKNSDAALVMPLPSKNQHAKIPSPVSVVTPRVRQVMPSTPISSLSAQALPSNNKRVDSESRTNTPTMNKQEISTKAGLNQVEKTPVAKAYVPALSTKMTSTLPIATSKVLDSAKHHIKAIDFKRGSNGAGQVIFVMSGPQVTVDMIEEKGRVVLDFQDMSLPQHLMRKFDVSDFATPVQQFEVLPKGKSAHVEILAEGDYEHLAYQTNNTYTVEFRPLTKGEAEILEKDKKGFDGERLSLNFQDIEVRAVLQLLGDFTQKNMVVSDTVDGSITLRLQNVPWDQALDIILRTKGLGLRENDNVILIAPAQELADQEKTELESRLQIEELAPLHSEFISIKYAKASDIAALLKSEDNQLLTPERGNVAVDKRTNTLLIRDTLAQIANIHRLIERLDVAVRQVMIDARVVNASNQFTNDIGVRFGYSVNGGATGGDQWVFGGSQPGGLSNTGNFEHGSALGNPNATILSPEGSGDALLVNLPSIASGGGFNLLLGKVGAYLLQLELTAMQSEGRGEIISSPRVITSDRTKATIKEGVQIAYEESSTDGTSSITFIDAVLSLEVTPQITPDDRVILDLVIHKDAADFGRSIAGFPPINTSQIETSVLVDNGETIVLGGVFEKDESYAERKIPLLGDLPYIGLLFKNRTEKNNSRELLIFVTPKILKETVGIR